MWGVGEMDQAVRIRIRAAAVLFCVLICVFIFSAAGVYAVGDGSGSGGGSSVALAMVSSSPSDGAGGVSTKPVISCRFSHNVADASVSSSNLTHLSLKKADGTPVSLRTYVADVQIEFDKRQYLYAEPVSALEEGTTYILTLSVGIQAKNGMITSSAQTVKFTTEGTALSTSSSGEQTSHGSTETHSSAISGTAAGSEAADRDSALISTGDIQDNFENNGTEDDGEDAFSSEENDASEKDGDQNIFADDNTGDTGHEAEEAGMGVKNTAVPAAAAVIAAAAVCGAVYAIRRRKKRS